MDHSDSGDRYQDGRPSQLPQHRRRQQQPAAAGPGTAASTRSGRSQQQLNQVPIGQGGDSVSQQDQYHLQQQRSWALQQQQQQQQQLYLQQRQQQQAAAAVAAGAYGAGAGRLPLSIQQQQQQIHQQQNIMAAAAAASGSIQNEYIATQQLRQRAQQQYLQQQHQFAAGHPATNTDAALPQPAGYPPTAIPQQQQYAQQLSYQQQQQQQQLAIQQSLIAAAAAAGAQPYGGAIDPSILSAASGNIPPEQIIAQQQQQQLPQPHHTSYIQPRVGRLPADRPLIKLSVSLIDTYKRINEKYYEEREARRAAKAKEKVAPLPTAGDGTQSHRPATKKAKSADAADTSGASGTSIRSSVAGASAESSAASSDAGGGGPSGPHNNGWDDENYDYIIRPGELFYGRYRIQERIGKGSFGQVVRAIDELDLGEVEGSGGREVAIKIIKSKKPFLMQAKTEIELLTHLNERDPKDENNIVRLITHFMYRNHQCLVFEMLSLNLYELLKNTQFGGVSLNLIRKFAKQVLKALSYLSRKDVDIIHCDLKPENILLRHPKKSGVKVIDFGSSCRSNKRMYSYIQSRFYRSPEVMLGLPYATSIDMWSLGCILAEMHTGEPLFSGSDQFDQMQKIVKLLGMLPDSMLDQASDTHRSQFFERIIGPVGPTWSVKQVNPGSTSRHPAPQQEGKTSQPTSPVVPSQDPIGSLNEVIRAETNRKKKYPPSETGNSPRNYERFVDLIHRMLVYEPRKRIKPEEALNHPFITNHGG